jgi:geranylgeranyl diphosphate synthase type II
MILQTLEKTKKLVFPTISSYLIDPIYPDQFKTISKFNKEINLYWDINNEYPTRMGKYLRPTLVRLIAECFGIKSKKVVKTAAAMQMSEEWILISDDIEDNSDERRNKPTLHRLHGIELAINASDALETIMWKMIIDINDTKITDEFYKIIMRTILGQAVEQIWTNKKEDITNEKYFFVADSKSAYYSIAGPIRLGAILGNATTNQIDRLTDFGLHLGRCFQLIDDILDEEQDKMEGKKTLVTTLGVEKVKELAKKEKEEAEKIFLSLKFLKKNKAYNELKELTNFILNRTS